MNFEHDSEILKALGHPIRLQIVQGLVNDECNVNKIAETLKTPQSTISQHLSILRTRGIVAPQKKGVVTCYKVTDPRVREIIRILNTPA